jgi:tRNA(Ile)-lysidine synthase
METRPRLTPPIANVRRAIRETFEMPELADTKAVLLAVSGGPDSMALALGANFELPKLGIRVFAAVVNHNLQPGSDEIAAQAAGRLETIGIQTSVLDIEVARTGSGPEAEAREARYSALEKQRVEVGAQFVVTGHNLDDQAETVMLGLTRGSGLRSIAGMKALDGKLVRPLLGIEKQELTQACIDSGVEYWLDPHNQDAAFTRVRIRNLMQQIEAELGPGVNESLARTASLAAEVDDFLTAAAVELVERARVGEGFEVKELAASHPAVMNKALHIICIESGASSISRTQVLSVAQLITNWHGQKSLSLSGITVERVREQILFRQSS